MIAVRAFEAGDLQAAAALLAERHERHRALQPLLAPIDPVRWLARSWEAASGGMVVTEGDGSLTAYLLWRLRENDVWGRYAWVDRADHASRSPEATRDVYAAAADGWVRDGYVKHAVNVPALDHDLDPFERLGFARMQVHALRALGDDPGAADPRIRPSDADDVDRDVQPFARVIWEHQATTPAFTGLTAPSWSDLRADWIATLEEDGVIHLVLDDGQPVGHALVYPADHELGWPDATARLAVVAVDPARRRQGIGRALTHAAFVEATRAGFAAMETDWRITNLLSSRTWPTLGFTPVFHRLWRVTGTG